MKADANQIRSFVDGLSVALGFEGSARARWPHHLFRVDDITAVARILDNGSLYSRRYAAEHGLLDLDAASPVVIENSPDWTKDFARLYFRPRTPTEYRSEGIRPKSALQMGAHRPVPVVLVFESIPILTADGTLFTNGNAASHSAKCDSTAKFFRSIPFEKVYFDSVPKLSEKAGITFHRCAEVLVPDKLDLNHLRHVLCRSQGEYETLINLLSTNTRVAYSQKIGISGRVHFRRWSFIESVDLTAQRVNIRFNPSSLTPTPFLAEAEIIGAGGVAIGRWRDENFSANGSIALNLHKLGNNVGTYRLRVTLDGCLAYYGTFEAAEKLL